MPSAITLFRAAFIAGLLAVLSGTALAQKDYVRPTEGIALPSPSATEVDDASALSVNPANLGFLQSWSLVYGGAFVNDQTHLSGQGHGFFFAFPAGPFGLGIGTEFLLPPLGVRDWQGLDRRARFSLGLSVNPIRAVGLGMAWRTFPAYDLGEAIHTLDLALTIRPINHLNFVFAFQDVNRPEISYAAIESSPWMPPEWGFATLPRRTEQAPRRFLAALTVRPFGTDRFSIGAELRYLYGEGLRFNQMDWSYENRTVHRTDVTGMFTWMIIDGLSLRTRFTAEGLRSPAENAFYLDTSLCVDSLRFPFGITASPYFKLAPDHHDGFEGMSWALRISGDQPASIPLLANPHYVVPITLSDAMDSHGFAALLALVERIENDASVDRLLLEVSSGALTLSQAFELNRRIGDLEERGIPTLCYVKDTDTAGLLTCAAAERIWINPAGGIRTAGISTRAFYFKDLLARIGVKADIVRVGEFKSAPETFTENGPTDPSALAMDRFLDSVYDRLTAAVADGRKFKSLEKARSTIESGPFIAKEALSAGLADKVVATDELEKELEKLSGKPVYIERRYGTRPLRSRTYLDSPKVAVLHIEGDIVDGESLHLPMFNIHTTGAKTVVEQIREIKEDTGIRAVVLRVDSPGGSALASDIIWRELMALRAEKPVIASMGTVAASGAYYVASAADLIFAEPTTLTGSIGIYYGKADLSGLLDKVGISTAVFKRGEHSDIDSWLREYTDEERAKLTKQLTVYYQLFLDRIIEGRGHGLTRDLLDKRARGRIWSGADAKHQLLVDRIGGYQAALDHARGLAFVSDGTKVAHYPEQKPTIMDRMARRMGVAGETPDLLTLSREVRETMKAALPFTMADHGVPQARLPFAIVEAP